MVFWRVQSLARRLYVVLDDDLTVNMLTIATNESGVHHEKHLLLALIIFVDTNG